MTGYVISIERLLASLVLGFGWVLHSLPERVQSDWLRLPRGMIGKLEVEVSALAWTLTAAGSTVALWTYTEWTRAGVLGRQRDSADGAGKKID